MDNFNIDNIDIDNNKLLEFIQNYNDFYDLSIIEYLSNSFIIHKERIKIKKNSLLINNDLSNNIINKNSQESIIFINNNSYNIIIEELYINNNLDLSYNNYEYICNANSNLIINNYYDTKILYKKNIDYLIFEDLCKSNKIIYNPNQLFENYSTINEKKNNIFLINDSNIINNDDCNYFVKLLNTLINNNDYNIEKWGNGSNVNCLFMNVTNIKNEELRKKIDTKIYNSINKIINYLYKEYDILCKGDSGYCLRKIYGATRQHKDSVLSNIHNNSETVYKNQIRNMSIIIALNDDYENGEFYFPRQNFKIKLKKGEIIIFPPYWTHPHFVTAPSNNTYRYTINTWLYE